MNDVAKGSSVGLALDSKAWRWHVLSPQNLDRDVQFVPRSLHGLPPRAGHQIEDLGLQRSEVLWSPGWLLNR